jgi:hypothetical protein
MEVGSPLLLCFSGLLRIVQLKGSNKLLPTPFAIRQCAHGFVRASLPVEFLQMTALVPEHSHAYPPLTTAGPPWPLSAKAAANADIAD